MINECDKAMKPALNLGCGDDTNHSYINGDFKPYKGVHFLLDLDAKYLPFKDHSVCYVLLQGVIAHVKHPAHLKKEIKRIVDGRVNIIPCGRGCEHYNSPHNKAVTYRIHPRPSQSPKYKQLTLIEAIMRRGL